MPTAAKRGPGSVRGSRSRSRRQNAHVTEERRVLYPWHPWFGLAVHVHGAIERRGARTFCCRPDGWGTGGLVELPARVVEPAARVSMRRAGSPQKRPTALAALDTLLRDAAGP